MDDVFQGTQQLSAVESDAGDGREWWRDAVMYQVYVRSFADSDGDGVGDLPGVASRLDYIADLGVDGIWLNPFYKSPQEDGGYDVADYFEVDPLFGTLADFDALLGQAHARGMRVLVDLVPNHTSSRHAWFQAALEAPPGSRERSRYIFRAGRGPGGGEPPNNWRSVFGGSAWSRVSDSDPQAAGGVPAQWYLHLFAPGQPDLNWECEEVRSYFDDVLRFWLGRGVDGFRIDVAHGMIKHQDLPDFDSEEEADGEPDPSGMNGDDHPYWDRDEVHDIYRRWRKILDAYPGERVFLAEAWVKTPERLARYLRPDELHMAFNFDFLKCDWDADAFARTISSTLSNLTQVGAAPTWVLSNHDVVRHVSRYGDGPTGLCRARAALLLMLALPGSAFVYQGEELGLPEVTDLPDDVLQDPTFLRTEGKVRGRDGCRVPIPWEESGPALGFSTAAPWLPQPVSWAQLSVSHQSHDATSTLALYRQACELRGRLRPYLAGPEFSWVRAAPGLVAFKRGDNFSCVVNCSDEPAELPAGVLDAGPVVLSSTPAATSLPSKSNTSHAASPIPANSALWFARTPS
ncbi:MAG: alpha-amylase family glycosyl hydrolase [Acidimicrobiales bacterium]